MLLYSLIRINSGWKICYYCFHFIAEGFAVLLEIILLGQHSPQIFSDKNVRQFVLSFTGVMNELDLSKR